MITPEDDSDEEPVCNQPNLYQEEPEIVSNSTGMFWETAYFLNEIMPAILLHFLRNQNNITLNDQTFLESGLSQMEIDCVHSTVKKRGALAGESVHPI